MRLREDDLHGLEQVNEKNEEEADFDHGHQRVVDQGVRVLVECLPSQKHQQVPDDMNDEIKEQREPRDADQDLRPDGGTENA